MSAKDLIEQVASGESPHSVLEASAKGKLKKIATSIQDANEELQDIMDDFEDDDKDTSELEGIIDLLSRAVSKIRRAKG